MSEGNLFPEISEQQPAQDQPQNTETGTGGGSLFDNIMRENRGNRSGFGQPTDQPPTTTPTGQPPRTEAPPTTTPTGQPPRTDAPPTTTPTGQPPRTDAPPTTTPTGQPPRTDA
ncbi:MAG: hypothetical protein K2Z81_18800, partial [Cyanobacteria bacterium]|nr:hypothetical protein [Cyanobacteriota bacterium]